MYETEPETNGLHGGFSVWDKDSPHGEPRAILPARQGQRAGRQNEGAGAWLQPNTGSVNFQAEKDSFSLDDKPLVIRWFSYLFALAFFSGILPCAICGLLIHFLDAFDLWWAFWLACALALWGIWRLVTR